MKRIDARSVEFTDMEKLVIEIHELLLDQGHSQGDALIMLRGSQVPPELRTATPLLDEILTPEFADWLAT